MTTLRATRRPKAGDCAARTACQLVVTTTVLPVALLQVDRPHQAQMGA